MLSLRASLGPSSATPVAFTLPSSSLCPATSPWVQRPLYHRSKCAPTPTSSGSPFLTGRRHGHGVLPLAFSPSPSTEDQVSAKKPQGKEDPPPYPNEEEIELWETRRAIARAFFTPVLKSREGKAKRLVTALEKRKAQGHKAEDEQEEQSPLKTAVLSTAFVVAIFAAITRVGGRAALLQLMGLDLLQDSNLQAQLSGFMSDAQALGPVLKWGYFLAAWVVAKTLCLDPLSLVLALASGILFDGVIQGTLASCVCATVASLVAFTLARTALREKIWVQIEKRPLLRAVERAVSKDGLKTVFTLRLSPLIPALPVGAYSYIYGVTSLPVLDFVLGIFAGSIKPYFLDAYLGVLGEGVLSGGASPLGEGGWRSDALLGVTFFLIVLVGTLASQVAGKAWDEARAEALALQSSSSSSLDKDQDKEVGWSWLAMLGIEPAQTGLRAIFEGEWARLAQAMDEEWAAMLSKFREDPSKGAAKIAQEVEGMRKGQEAVPPRSMAVQEGGKGERTAEALLGLLCFPLVLIGQVGDKAGVEMSEAEARQVAERLTHTEQT